MQKELTKLQGQWNVTSLEVDGTSLPTGAFAGARIVIEDNRFTSFAMGAAYGGTMSVNTRTNPKSFSLKFTEGPEKGNTNQGIYELDGNRWKICLSTTGGPAPNAFSTSPGSGHALETLERGAAAVGVEPPALEMTGRGPISELEGEWAMVSCIRNGDPLGPMMVKGGKRVTRGNDTTVFFGDHPFLKTTFTLDPSQQPKTIDLGNAGEVQRGIYELDGETMKICYAAPGERRPSDYATARGDGRTMAVWQRTKK